METVLHRASTRGHINHGWLDAHHTFSFASYRDPSRVHFGVLRVLNDDTVAGGMGFDMHPHENMEIVSIILQGAIKHHDSMGNASVIHAGSIQAMSAGKGLMHSEYNSHPDQVLELLQIWLFPNQKNVEPRYDVTTPSTYQVHNQLCLVVSPDRSKQGVWIHQDAWFYLASCDKDVVLEHRVQRKENGVYIFVIDGQIEVAGQSLNRRDGFGLWQTDQIAIKANSPSRILLMDIPMNL